MTSERKRHGGKQRGEESAERKRREDDTDEKLPLHNEAVSDDSVMKD